MLGGQISNQDEEEVEDELRALENEILGEEPVKNPRLPEAPIHQPETEGNAESQERVKQREPQAMLAA